MTSARVVGILFFFYEQLVLYRLLKYGRLNYKDFVFFFITINLLWLILSLLLFIYLPTL